MLTRSHVLGKLNWEEITGKWLGIGKLGIS